MSSVHHPSIFHRQPRLASPHHTLSLHVIVMAASTGFTPVRMIVLLEPFVSALKNSSLLLCAPPSTSPRHTLTWSNTNMASIIVCSVGVVPQWFSKRRSFASSIAAAAAAGGGIGGLTYSLASQAMIQSIGLGWAFRVLAILTFAANTLCTILIRNRNKAVGAVQLTFHVKLFKRKEFLLCNYGDSSPCWDTLYFCFPPPPHPELRHEYRPLCKSR
jgi:hypothetical protein